MLSLPAPLSCLLILVIGATHSTVFASSGRQPYDVRKIIDAFRQPHDDLRILCAHRGLRWNATADNSRTAYFRAVEAGIECIETDIRLSKDGYLTMLHDEYIGRETDVGEYMGLPAYNPFTGQGYSPAIKEVDYKGFVENLHLRDEMGRVTDERTPLLEDIIDTIYEENLNVVLQLDFKDQDAVEKAYWSLKSRTNKAGVPANEWCIYKLQARWWKTPEEFEAEPWVQDAFASGIQLAYIPVFTPQDRDDYDQIEALAAFMNTNYTISIEVNMRGNGPDAPGQELLDFIHNSGSEAFTTTGIFYAPGDFVEPSTSELTSFDTANYTLPDDMHAQRSVWVYRELAAPVLLDSTVGNQSADGHDWRSDFDWILEQGNSWIIADVPDYLSSLLEQQGLRNVQHFIAAGESVVDGRKNGYYKRHSRDWS